MSKQSIIKVNKNSATNIDFQVEIEGIEEKHSPTVRLVIENVVSGCDVTVAAKHKKDNEWTVTVPNLKNFTKKTYKTYLEVVVDGYHFVPAKGTVEITDDPVVKVVSEHVETDDIVEGINSGTTTASGPDTQVTNNLTGKPEFPIEAKLHNAQGENSDEATDEDALDDIGGVSDGEKECDGDDSVTIDDIAARVVGTQGPQLPIDDEEPAVFDAKDAAKRAIESVAPFLKTKSATKGKLFNEKTVKKLARGKDPAYIAEVEEKSRKVRDILGIK